MGKSKHDQEREGGKNASKGDSIGSRDDRMDGKGNLTAESGKHQDSNLRGPDAK